jgi:hypothetical protein
MTDAAIEKEDVSGLGGFLAGLHWHIPLVGDERLLPISVAEFIAVVVGFMVFEPFVGQARPTAYSDSLNSVDVIEHCSAISPVMQYTHIRALEIPEYAQLAGPGTVVHCYGPANPCADAVSRGRFELLAQLCSQLGIAPVRLEVPPAARELLNDVVSFARRNGLLTAGPRRRLHSTSVELGAAAQVANGFGHRGTVQDGAAVHVAGEYVGQPRKILTTRRRPERLATVAVQPHGLSPVARAAGTPVATRRRKEHSSILLPSKGTHAVAPHTRLERLAPPAQVAGDMPNAVAARRVRPERVAPQSAVAAAIDMSVPSKKRAAAEGGGWGRQGDAARFKPTSETEPRVARRGHEGRSKGQERLREAAEARIDQLVERLTNDPSPLALKPDDSNRLYGMCAAHITAAATVPAAGTMSADGTAWRRWVEYCRSLNTPPVRSYAGAPDADDAAAADREAILQSGFLIHLVSVIEPRSKSDPAAKPQSLFNNLLAVRRVHQRLMVEFHIMRGTALLLKAQVRAFIQENGPEALLPARKEPLDASQLRQVFHLRRGIAIGGRTLDWESYYFVSYKALLCTGLAAAFRKAELCVPDGVEFSLGRLSVASVSWVIGGRAVAQASYTQLRAVTEGDFCVIKPPLCKNDPFGLHFGTKPIWLPVGGDSANAARALAAMFLAGGTYPEQPERTALFRSGVEGPPLRHSEADRVLRDLLMATFPRANTSRWSLHSLRIGAASALLAAGASPALIQAICRWRSPKSVEIYARMGPIDYGRYVLQIERQAVDAVTAKRVLETRIDYDSVVAFLDGAVSPAGDTE